MHTHSTLAGLHPRCHVPSHFESTPLPFARLSPPVFQQLCTARPEDLRANTPARHRAAAMPALNAKRTRPEEEAACCALMVRSVAGMAKARARATKGRSCEVAAADGKLFSTACGRQQRRAFEVSQQRPRPPYVATTTLGWPYPPRTLRTGCGRSQRAIISAMQAHAALWVAKGGSAR